MLTVITGPPCSGKSTYARKHALPGEIVVDFDAIAVELGSPVGHDHAPEIRVEAAEEWHRALDRAVAAHRRGRRAWVIDARPSPKRLAWYRTMRARITDCTATREELTRRAVRDGRSAETLESVRAWFAREAETSAAADPEPARRTRW